MPSDELEPESFFFNRHITFFNEWLRTVLFLKNEKKCIKNVLLSVPYNCPLSHDLLR